MKVLRCQLRLRQHDNLHKHIGCSLSDNAHYCIGNDHKRRRMILNLLLALMIALFINGIDITFSRGYLMYPVKRWLDKNLNKGLGKWLYTPLIGCNICMTSLWGIPIYFMLLDLIQVDQSLIWMPIVLIASIPINGLIAINI